MFVQLIFLFPRKQGNIYCTILYYHSIPDYKKERFIKQLNILNKITTPIKLDYSGPFNNKVKYSIVTFDDAFKSVITNAVPELEKLQIPFTIFIPEGQLGRKPEWLINTGYHDEHEIVSSIEELLSIPTEIVIFGSHGVNHNNLTQLNDKDAYIDIKDSKEKLSLKLNQEINYFAFPHGSYNSKIQKYCYEVRYKKVFSAVPESPLAPLNIYVKGRTSVDPADWEIEFILKSLGAYGWSAISKSIRQTLKNIFS